MYGQTTKGCLSSLGVETLAGFTRIDAGLRLLLEKKLPPRGSGSSTFPSRDQSHAVVPTELAKAIAPTYEKGVQAAWVERAGGTTAQRRVQVPAAVGDQGQSRNPRAPRAPREQRLVGEIYDDEGTI